MCNAWNHSAGCTCGWGGDGHLGSAHGHLWHGGLLGDPRRHPDLLGQIAVRYRTSFCIPTDCWHCSQKIYIYSNEYGSLVLFDELGWPWPKHDCPNAPMESKGESIGRPRAFMARMPPALTKWFQVVLENLEEQGKDSAYAVASEIPFVVSNGQYELPRPTLEFLRHLSRANKLRRGVFLPLPCASCSEDIWAFVPTSGDPQVVESRPDGTFRSHHCGIRGSSKTGGVRASLPRSLSLREVETKLRAGPKRGREAKPDETVIGFVTAQVAGRLHLKTLTGQVVEVPSSVRHPVYSFVVSMPDPFAPGKFVVRAPTFEQFVHGLPESLPKIVSEATLRAAEASVTPKSPSLSSKAAKSAARFEKQPTPKPFPAPNYPEAFGRPEVVAFLKTVSLDLLPEKEQRRWRALEISGGWHLGGLVPVKLARQFAGVLENAEREPEHRVRHLTQLRHIGQHIASQVKTRLKHHKPRV